MKDAFKQDLEVGDKVLYAFVSGRGACVQQGEVLSFTKEMVRVDLGDCEYMRVNDPNASYGYRYEKTSKVKPRVVCGPSLTKIIDKNGVLVYEHRYNGCRA